MLLSKIQHLIPNILSILKKLEDNPKILYKNIDEFQNPSSTYIRVKVAGVSSLAVLDTGAPLGILSSYFTKQSSLDPDVEYNKNFWYSRREKCPSPWSILVNTNNNWQYYNIFPRHNIKYLRL